MFLDFGRKPCAKVAPFTQRSASQLAASLYVPAARLSCRLSPLATHARSQRWQPAMCWSCTLSSSPSAVAMCAHRDPRPVPSYTPEACMLTTVPSFLAHGAPHVTAAMHHQLWQFVAGSLVRDGAQDGATNREARPLVQAQGQFQ